MVNTRSLLEKDFSQNAERHHICYPPAGTEFREGFCTVFALSSAASYLTGCTPEDAFASLIEHIQDIKMEDSPLADIYRLGLYPPIISDEGTSYLDLWLKGDKAELVIEFLNSILQDDPGIQIKPILPHSCFDLTWLRLRDACCDGLPIELCGVIRNVGSGKRTNHSLLLSPLSTIRLALIHDSNCLEVQSIPWKHLRDMACGSPIRLSEKLEIEIDLAKPITVVTRAEA